MKPQKKICTLLSVILIFSAFINPEAATFYVSPNGNDSNTGTTENTAFYSLSAAYRKLSGEDNIILLGNTTYQEPPTHTGNLTLKGNNSNITLTLPSQISLGGNLKLEQMVLSGTSTLYANGHQLEIANNVTSNNRLNVFGGKNAQTLNGDTDLRLLGGRYNNIYGGGNGGQVNGSTNVVLGGNANSGDGINDDASDISPCMVYGGGSNAKVTGKTNVTLQDSATAKYLVGAGTGTNGTATDTNIYINGGQVMNVYGGSQSTTLPAGTMTHITISGGKAESLFGGCEGVALTGHTFINLLGGEVTRRVYTGCYNETNTFATSYKSDRYVNGTTVLSITPSTKANTGSGLSGTNAVNVGVFSGSRTKSQHDAEQNTIIYLDNSFNSKKSIIGDKSLLSYGFKSFADYVVKAGEGGTVSGTTQAKTAYAQPDYGNYAKVGSAYYIDESFATASSIDVSFGTNFSLATPTATQNAEGVLASVDVISKNVKNEAQPQVLFGLYDADGVFVAGGTKDVSASDTQAQVQLNTELVSGETYQLRAFLWSENQKVLMTDTVTSFIAQ